jgi:N-acetylmuramoyl-L-alanine amidase
MRSSLVAISVLLAACATAKTPATTTSPAPAPHTEASPALPPVPLVEGALKPVVVYPVANSLVESRDSNFIFGSVGNGHAKLWINGTPVEVHPNGAYLAFLAVPPADSPRYDLTAILGTDTARLVHPVRLRPPVIHFTADGALAYDSSSAAPGGRLTLRDDDTVCVSVRTASNASVVWKGDQGAAVALTPDGETFATEIPARMLRARTELLLARGRDTTHVPVAQVVPALANQWATIGSDSSGADATDEELIGRPVPGGTYKWFLLPGTALEVTGRNGEFSRVRLDRHLEIWVSTSELHPLRLPALPPRLPPPPPRGWCRRPSGWISSCQ